MVSTKSRLASSIPTLASARSAIAFTMLPGGGIAMSMITWASSAPAMPMMTYCWYSMAVALSYNCRAMALLNSICAWIWSMILRYCFCTSVPVSPSTACSSCSTVGWSRCSTRTSPFAASDHVSALRRIASGSPSGKCPSTNSVSQPGK
ncbi:hypothetical protein [Nocardia arthritidis]|uniref:hypothetical protein n=1 Tax=Nocardia arthritidis TaxID=228602 RepID=UPI0012ECEB64|nr:hypothetical protein [Nocardia arthritidis]